ncbi:MAG: hypothetical protein AB7G75_03575 [Candidatus Binatia bacterium]
MKYTKTLSALAVCTLLAPTLGVAQTDVDFQSLKKEVEELKAGQKAIQDDLKEIKTLLRSAPGRAPTVPQNVTLKLGDSPLSKGEKTAKLTLVEFTDFQ